MNIYINDKAVQEKVKKDFGLDAPLYCVIDTTSGLFNSPLWFEMFAPDEKVIDNYLNE